MPKDSNWVIPIELIPPTPRTLELEAIIAKINEEIRTAIRQCGYDDANVHVYDLIKALGEDYDG